VSDTGGAVVGADAGWAAGEGDGATLGVLAAGPGAVPACGVAGSAPS
jgi:hypothetical protein